MKIVVLDGQGLNPGDLSYDCLKQFGDLTVYDQTFSEEEAVSRIGDHDIVLVNKVPITESLLVACPNIKLICVQATGYNIVDCDACTRRNIPVCNVPSYGTAAVAQFTLALMLELCHRIGIHDASVHQGDWVRSPGFCYWLSPQMELAGKTLGIIGYGRIGQAVEALAKAFGMQVLIYSRSTQTASLDTLLAKSDFVTLHCPLNSATDKLINEETIARMKDGAFLINTSRGGVLDEQAVADALISGKLRGAALDVVTQEPMAADNPLLSAPNCIITPHIAWAPLESRQRLLDCVVENVRMFLNGTPQNVVNEYGKIIKTPRLEIKAFSRVDREKLSELLVNEEIRKTYMIPDFPSQEALEEMITVLMDRSHSDSHFVRGIYSNQELIGFINDVETGKDVIELGYVIHPNHWGKGYATETLKAVIHDLSGTGFSTITAGAFCENIASIRVMEKCGMRKTVKSESIEYRGIHHSCAYYEWRM